MTQQAERVPIMCAKDREQNIVKIRTWVDAFRQRTRVENIGRAPLAELSCFAFGEGYNLLIRQLVNTEFPYGHWSELTNDSTGEIIQLILDEMPKH